LAATKANLDGVEDAKDAMRGYKLPTHLPLWTILLVARSFIKKKKG
jgi:hypothetical protein